MFCFVDCRFACHRKCYQKVTVECGKEISPGDNVSVVISNNVFGVPLHLLASGNNKVPLVVERLITTIEMYGLYMEGIYRKSGVRFCLSY